MPRYALNDLNEIYDQHLRPGYGAIKPDEVLFVQELIESQKPKNFIEIGMASGLSGGLISNMLERNDADSFVSLDHNNTFFGDTSKPNGFLIDEIYKGSRLSVQKKPFHRSLDIGKLGTEFQMSFIDANHRHPWPTIDTAFLYPYLTGEKTVIHHDYCLFRTQRNTFGVGPKFLYDQFDPAIRITSSANGGNIFALHLKEMTADDMEQALIDAIYLPWSLGAAMPEDVSSQILERMAELYSQRMCDAFAFCLERHNKSI